MDISNRSNVKTNNANAFNPNIANPFLVTTYAPPSLALYAKNAAITDISSIISTIQASLSSIINYADYSLSISTIRPVGIDVDPTQTVNIRSNIFNINTVNATNITTPLTTITGNLTTTGVTRINTGTANTLTVKNLNFSTASGSPSSLSIV